MFTVCPENLCINETSSAVMSISTSIHVPQPIEEKAHFVKNRIFVGGFPKETTVKELSATFQTFGRIIEANIIQSDRNKCYGFVTFDPSDTEVVELILNEYLCGRLFYVKSRTVVISRAAFRPKKVSMRFIESKVISPPPVVNSKTTFTKANEKPVYLQSVYPISLLSSLESLKLNKKEESNVQKYCNMQNNALLNNEIIANNGFMNSSNWFGVPKYILK